MIIYAAGHDVTVASPVASKCGGAPASDVERAKYSIAHMVPSGTNIPHQGAFRDRRLWAAGKCDTNCIQRLSVFAAERRDSIPDEREQGCYERITDG